MRDSSVQVIRTARSRPAAVNPPCILEAARWYAVRTSFRHEKIACRDLERAGLHAWVPLLRENRIYATKRRVVELPLFNAYIFVKLEPEAFHQVLKCPYTRGFVRFGKEVLPIPEHEIEVIRRVIGESEIQEASQREMLPGDCVEIIGGKLTGIQGVLENPGRNNLMSIRIESMGYTLVIEVDPRYIQPVSRTKYRHG